MLIKDAQLNEALRVAFTITLCMLMGKLVNFNSPVYLALYPCIVMTKCKDYSWLGLVKTFLPTFLATCVALVVCELFTAHPFIIWTISLFFFDFMRRNADTPKKLGALIMPTFNWILIIVLAQHTPAAGMPMRIHEILLSMLFTMLIAKLMLVIFPQQKGAKVPRFTAQAVTFKHRFCSLALIGLGLAFLMLVDLISATFCMVPVIAAATQFNRGKFREVVEHRFITQVGGCALAVLFTLLMAGHQNNIAYYALLLGSLLFVLGKWMASSQGTAKDTHADAILATMLPIQLYMGNTSLGLENTYLRAWELTLTLAILLILYRVTDSKETI